MKKPISIGFIKFRVLRFTLFKFFIAIIKNPKNYKRTGRSGRSGLIFFQKQISGGGWVCVGGGRLLGALEYSLYQLLLRVSATNALALPWNSQVPVRA